MLVLSRRADQQIAFPGLGITLSILQVKGRIVKVGIDAPPEIAIKRNELVTEEDLRTVAATDLDVDEPSIDRDQSEHRRRNQLNTLQLYVDSIQMRLENREHIDAKKLVQSLISALQVDNYEISSSDTSQPKEDLGTERLLRVLVVEDSDNERGLMTYLLASYGFVVYVARDGVEAFEQLSHGCGSPDVVLMDIDMPSGNGIEAMTRFRSDPTLSHLLIYAVTGARRDPLDEPVGRGWDRWFCKPVNVRQLVGAIREDCAVASRDQNDCELGEVSL